ncbi:MAG: LCP family protein [Actinomycetota bacterium]|nr:LCP family protein [Actinomycetota bacterium]
MEKQKNKRWFFRIPRYGRVLIIVAASLIVLAGAAAGVFFYYINSLNEAINASTTSEIESILTPIESPQEPVTVLLLGRDSRDSEVEAGRADTIMLLYLNPAKTEGTLMSIPRDTLVDIPGYGEDKINAAYAYGQEELMIRTVSDFLDADINHFITLDFNGFVQLIDALGGVDVVVERPMEDEKSGTFLSAGNHHLTGEQALSYTRDRSTELGDIGRIQRQQQIFKALVEQKLNLNYVSDIPHYFNLLVKNTRTDLDVMTILKYSKAALSFDPDKFQTAIVPSHPDWIEDGTISVQIPDIEEARAMWERITRGEPASKYNATYVEENTLPDSMSANLTYKFQVTVKNTGAVTWERNGKQEAFFLGYHWIDFDTKQMVVFDGDRTFLPRTAVEPGEEVTFELNVRAPSDSGRYILQVDMVQENVTWFSYQGVPPYEKMVAVDVDYAALYDDFGTTPLYMKPGERFPVTIWLKNTGSIVWENSPDLEINLGYHWLDRDSREPVMWDNGRRLHIDNLEPGQELEQDIVVFAPEEPGRYLLQYDLVHERVTWFSAEGVTPLEINVDVGQTVDKSITTDTRIFIANGNGLSGVASRMSSYLRVYGFKISELANADSFNYEKTVIYYTQENKDKADQLALVFDSYEKIQIQPDRFEQDYGQDSDVAVIVGQDYLDNIE